MKQSDNSQEKERISNQFHDDTSMRNEENLQTWVQQHKTFFGDPTGNTR